MQDYFQFAIVDSSVENGNLMGYIFYIDLFLHLSWHICFNLQRLERVAVSCSSDICWNKPEPFFQGLSEQNTFVFPEALVLYAH